MNKQVICLMGPTASGKTAIACELVARFPCEIISVDSAMIYREMDIGTAKPDSATLALAPHALIDILNPNDAYSAAEFCSDARTLCEASFQRGKIPLLVGGTMMYYRALQQGLSTLPEANEDIRQQLLAQANELGWAHMHELLRAVDPIAAARIHVNDTQRIQRALEVFQVTGKSLTDCLQDKNHPTSYRFINVSLIPSSRAWLHERIAVRFKEMIASGFIDEVAELIKRWQLNPSMPSLRCVGYRQVYDYLTDNADMDSLLDKGIAATRQLAKRQLTWLRHWPASHEVDAQGDNVIDDVIRLITCV